MIAFTKNFPAFTPNPKTYGSFDYKTFITGYLGIPLYLIMIAGYKFWTKCPAVRPETADLFSGKDAIDREEEEFLRNQEAERASGKKKKGGKLYRNTIGVLF